MHRPEVELDKMDQANATIIEKYIANNTGSIVQHLDQQNNWIRVSAGDHLKIMAVGLGLAENLTASRVGDDLVVYYTDGTSVVFIGYFTCTINSDPNDDDSCSITLAGDDEPYLVPGGAGFNSGNSQVIYHQGDTAYALATQLTLEDSELDKVIATADDQDMMLDDNGMAGVGAQLEARVEPAVGAGIGLIPGLLGGGLVVGVAAGGGSSGVSLANIVGSLVLGPISNARALSVQAFAPNGEGLGSALVNADGSYSLTLNKTYSGYVLLKAIDSNDATDHMDEATRVETDITTDLRAVVKVTAGQTTTAIISPATEIAVLELGLAGGDEGSSANKFDHLSEDRLASINAQVAQALGIGAVDLTQDTPITTVDVDGNIVSHSDAYGDLLAALSGMEKNTGKTTQQVLREALKILANDELSGSVKLELLAGAKAGNGDVAAVGASLGIENASAVIAAWQAVENLHKTPPTGAALTQQEVSLLGVTNVTSNAQLAVFNDLVKGLTIAETDSLAELESLGLVVNKMLSGAQSGQPALNASDYAKAGMTNINEDKEVALLNQRLAEQTSNDKASLAAIQATAKAVEVALGGTTKVTAEQLALLGIVDVNSDSLAAVQSAVLAYGPRATSLDDLRSYAKQEASAATEALAKVRAVVDGTNTGVTAETMTQLAIEGVTADNVTALNSYLKQGPDATQLVSQQQVQDFVDALVAVENSADGKANLGTLISQQQLQTLSVPHAEKALTASLIADRIAQLPFTEVDDFTALTNLANAAQAVMDHAQQGTPNLTISQLELLGVAGISADNLAVFENAIEGADVAALASVDGIDGVFSQALTAFDQALVKVNNSIVADQNPIPNAEDYLALGLQAPSADIVAAMGNWLQHNRTEEAHVDSAGKIQNKLNAWSHVFGQLGNTGMQSISIVDLQELNVINVEAGSDLSLLNQVVAASSLPEVNDINELQVIANAIDHLLATAAKTDASNASLLSIKELAVFAAPNAVLLAQHFDNDYVAAIETNLASSSILVTNVNQLSSVRSTIDSILQQTALNKLVSSTTSATLVNHASQEYTVADIHGVNDSNLAFVNSFWALDGLITPTAITNGGDVFAMQKAWFQDHVAIIIPVFNLIGDSSSDIALNLAGVQALLSDTVTAEQVNLFEQIIKNRSDRPQTATDIVEVMQAVVQLSDLADGTATQPLLESELLTVVDFHALGMSAVDSDMKAGFMSKALNGRELSTVDIWADVQALDVALEHWFADSSLTGLSDPLTVADVVLLYGDNFVKGASAPVSIDKNNLSAIQTALDIWNASTHTTYSQGLEAHLYDAAVEATAALSSISGMNPGAVGNGVAVVSSWLSDLSLYGFTIDNTSAAIMMQGINIDGTLETWQEVQVLANVVETYVPNGVPAVTDKAGHDMWLAADILSSSSFAESFNSAVVEAIVEVSEKALNRVSDTGGATEMLSLSDLQLMGLGVGHEGALNETEIGLYNNVFVTATSVADVDTLAEINAAYAVL
jgi:hypothetical protein